MKRSQKIIITANRHSYEHRFLSPAPHLHTNPTAPFVKYSSTKTALSLWITALSPPPGLWRLPLPLCEEKPQSEVPAHFPKVRTPSRAPVDTIVKLFDMTRPELLDLMAHNLTFVLTLRSDCRPRLPAAGENFAFVIATSCLLMVCCRLF